MSEVSTNFVIFSKKCSKKAASKTLKSREKSERNTATERVTSPMSVGSEAVLLGHGHFVKGHEHHKFFP